MSWTKRAEAEDMVRVNALRECMALVNQIRSTPVSNLDTLDPSAREHFVNGYSLAFIELEQGLRKLADGWKLD